MVDVTLPELSAAGAMSDSDLFITRQNGDTTDTKRTALEVKTYIGALTVVNWGDIGGTLSSQTDLQTALDGKVDENSPITGATNTKITYDAKGLVTSGTAATTADINDSSNRRYVTDAQLVVIGNTSGTNTGDQTTITGNAGTATALQNARNIGGVSFNGTADIVPQTIQMVNDAADTTCFILFGNASGSVSQQPKTNTGLIYNASTNNLGATTFTGALVGNVTGNVSGSSGSTTGNAATATILATGRTIAITGDLAYTSPSFNGSTNVTAAGTLATVNANVGSFGSATAAGTFTVNAKGLITAAGSTTITPAVGSITGLGTGVATALAINVGTAGSPVLNGGSLGTPSSGVATNLTGTASGLTAGTVTTNANLTGDVTSVGNATAIAAGVIVNADVNASAAIALTKLAATTVSRALVSDASGFITPATTTSTEIGYVNGVTSAIQGQINAKAPLASPTFTGTVTLPAGQVVNGVTLTAAGSATDFLNAAGNYVAAGAPSVTANRAVVSDGTGALIAATTTDTEIGYVNGVTSAIQTQIDSKYTTGSAFTITDDLFTLQDNLDTTKNAIFQLSGITTATTRTLTVPNASGTLALLSGIAQTFTTTTTFSGTLTHSAATGNYGSNTGAATYQLGYGATTNGTTKTINIGTAGVSGSITNLNLGSAVSGATGTMTINSPTVNFSARNTAINVNYLTASTSVFTDASKNLISVTNTGTGNNVLATSPTLVTPILGTPASGTLTNCTGYSATNLATGTLPVARMAANTIIDRVYAEYTTNAVLATVIPADDTIPQNTEGTQILSVAITPKSTSTRLRARFQGFGGCSAAADNLIAALFLNSSAGAATATTATSGAAFFRTQLALEYEWVPGSVSSQTIAIRVGAGVNSMGLNGINGTRILGGVARCTLVVEEIQQ